MSESSNPETRPTEDVPLEGEYRNPPSLVETVTPNRTVDPLRSSDLNSAIPADLADVLHSIANQVMELSHTTNSRFAEIADTQQSYGSQLGELRQLYKSPTAANQTAAPADTVTELRRDLFGNTPPPQDQSTMRNPLDHRSTTATDQSRRTEAQSQRYQIAEMQKIIQAMASKLHQVTSSAPEIDQVLRRAQNTPFTDRLLSTPLRPQEKLKITHYDGRSDPSQFMTAFSIAMGRTRFTPAERDSGFCQMFVENLTGSALGWFSRLEANTVDSYDQLSTAFLKHYSMHIKQGVSDADLYTIQQAQKETLRAFVGRFKAIASEVTISDQAAIPALRHALWHESEFRRDLTLNKPQTLEDALHRAAVFIQIEDEKAAMTRKHVTPNKPLVTKEKAYDSRPEPQHHYDDNRRGRPINYQINDPSRERSWNKYERIPIAPSSNKDLRAYCEFHKTYGHTTEECRTLRDRLFNEYKEKSKPLVEPLEKPNERREHEGGRQQQRSEIERSRRAKAEGKRKIDSQSAAHPASGIKPPKQEYSYTDALPPPPARRRINMIMGGLVDCTDSVRSVQAHERRAHAAQKWKQGIFQTQASLDSSKAHRNVGTITFKEEDLEGIATPHNDPLVVELTIGNCDVAKVMIDTGSSVDLIFSDTLEKMGISSPQIKLKSKPLTSFDGEAVMTQGTIKLPISVGGITVIIKFDVVNKPAIYNVILGTPWLFSMKAVPSTYHQCVKFPTPDGIFTLRGDQRVARSCFVSEFKRRRRPPQDVVATVLRHFGPRPPYSEPLLAAQTTVPANERSIVQVNIDERDKARCVGIGANLDPVLHEQLVVFLRANSSTFAWSMADMVGIDLTKACHELNVDPAHKPVKQKRRKLGPERAQAVNDEVERLTKAGSIVEVQYPDWLANPVVVKKKNGKWRVCVDFTDLNKACPKDSFPLPHIDRLVEATAGHELLSFMDAFSGYNQIMMNPNDREKTAFITDRGTYCYKVMPFGLKNAGATYQRLVNRMFADQLGTTMEVYIDDMLVKSKLAGDHVDHLAACFANLNLYRMKLNPAKCTFAVTSGEFLGYIITQRGIEANPAKIAAIMDLPPPRNPKEVQRLTGRIAALNRFISRSTDRCLPFYQLLRGNKRFEWHDQCAKAFAELKEYLTTPPILAVPELGDVLYLYVAVSAAAVSGVLVRDDRGEQRPVNYVSKSLVGPEARYTAMEKLALAIITSARKLRPYFQSHTIAVMTDQPLRTILHSPTQSGRLTKWAVELSEYDIDYRSRTAAKSQVLADFLVELPPESTPIGADKSPWSLYVDGSSKRNGSGIGIHLVSPTGEVIEQSFRLDFIASNNESEYEALLAGLRLAKAVGAKGIHAYCDSQLVTSQVSGDYETRNDRMEAYLQAVRALAESFDPFELVKIPRSDNAEADALAALASTSDPAMRRIIPVETIDYPSITPSDDQHRTTEETLLDERSTSVVAEPAPGNLATGDRFTQDVTTIPLDAMEVDIQPDSKESRVARNSFAISLDSGQGMRPEEGVPDDWRDEIRLYLADGITPHDKWKARRLKARSARYVLLNDELFRWSASRMLMTCIYGNTTTHIMHEIHEGAGGNHSGGRALALKIKKQGLFWPSMIRDCEEYAKNCEKCQRHAPAIHVPSELLTTSVAPYPFMRWAMDIIGPFPLSRQKRFVLVMTDYFTKWVEAESYARIRSTEVTKFVWKFIICRHGLPYEIATDNGSQFISPAFENFCTSWKIRLNKSTPRYPQGNGQAEATNKTILDGLKKRLDDSKGSWADELDGVLWSHRTTPKRATTQTPFSLSHGMEAMSPAEVGVSGPRQTFLVKHSSLNDEVMCNTIDNIEEERDKALLRIQNYQQTTSKYYNSRVRGRHLVEGDLVLRKIFENTKEINAGKLGANWEGPYIISRIVKPGVYEILAMSGDRIPRSWNIANLKRFYY